MTILKPFFDQKHPLAIADSNAMRAFVPIKDGAARGVVDVVDANSQPAALTVEGELNKVASNIAIGRY